MTLPQELRKLAKKGGGWHEFFDMLTTYQKRTTDIKADNAATHSGLAYETVVGFLKELGRLKVGDFKYGRHGRRTRLTWLYSPASVGAVALGRADELDSYTADDEPAVDDDTEKDDSYPAPTLITSESNAVAGQKPRGYAEILASAKRDLAKELGIAPEQIEIIIKH